MEFGQKNHFPGVFGASNFTNRVFSPPKKSEFLTKNFFEISKLFAEMKNFLKKKRGLRAIFFKKPDVFQILAKNLKNIGFFDFFGVFCAKLLDQKNHVPVAKNLIP